MKKSIKLTLAGLLLVPLLALGSLVTPFSSPVSAKLCQDGTTVANDEDCPKGELPQCLFGKDCAFTQITNTALFIIGALSVLMLIYGGIRYTISGGDSANVTAAKNTILYAVIGLVIALLSYAIVNFVLTTLK